MKTSFVKSLGAISLSVLLIYSGVAWALENCLENGDAEERSEYSENSITPAEAVVLSLASPANPDGHPITIIHCMVSYSEVGPMVQSSSESRLARSEKSALLKVSSPGGSLVASEIDSLWSRALLDWYVLLSSPNGISRYLLLSVLRI